MTIATLGQLLENNEATKTYSLTNFCKFNYNNTVSSVILNDYLDILKGSAKLYNLSDKELHKYLYDPIGLARDIYGDPNLSYVILMINNMTNMKEFDKHKIYLIDKEVLFNIINDIYNHENENII